MSKATSHENYRSVWQTPPEWMEWVKATLGDNFFDPCPHPCPPRWDGTRDPWVLTNTYVNHPGDKSGKAKHEWWKLFNLQLYRGHDGIWACFSSEQCRLLSPSPFELDGWLVMPDVRIKWLDEWGEPQPQPTSWSWFWSSKKPSPTTPETCWIMGTGANR